MKLNQYVTINCKSCGRQLIRHRNYVNDCSGLCSKCYGIYKSQKDRVERKQVVIDKRLNDASTFVNLFIHELHTSAYLRNLETPELVPKICELVKKTFKDWSAGK